MLVSAGFISLTVRKYSILHCSFANPDLMLNLDFDENELPLVLGEI